MLSTQAQQLNTQLTVAATLMHNAQPATNLTSYVKQCIIAHGCLPECVDLDYYVDVVDFTIPLTLTACKIILLAVIPTDEMFDAAEEIAATLY